MRTNNAKRLIFISTSAVYENNKEEIFSENLSVKPNFTYAMSKRAAEIACIGYAQNYGLDIVIPRFFNVFGEHQDIQRKMPPFTGYLVREVLAGRTPHLFNKSPAKRDYVNVHDVKALLTEMVQSPKRYCGEIFNVCSGAGHSVPEIVKCLGTILGVQITPQYHNPEEYWENTKVFIQDQTHCPDGELSKKFTRIQLAVPKDKQEFGFSPKVDFEMDWP